MPGIVSRLNEDLWSRIETVLASSKSTAENGKDGEKEEEINGEGSIRFMITVWSTKVVHFVP